MTRLVEERNEVGPLQEEVQRKLGSRVTSFRIEVESSKWILNGVSQTFYGKQLALHFVKQAAPGRQVENAIEVR